MTKLPYTVFSFFVLMLMTQTASAAIEEKVMCSEGDQKHIFKANHPFAEALYDCSSLSGLNVECFKGKYQGPSPECMTCYSRMTKCTINHCTGKCMWSPKGEGCRDCAHLKCGDALSKCIGLPKDMTPDFKRS